MHHNKYYAGVINETKSSDNERDCALSCAFKDGCVSYNYNDATSECVLISSSDGSLEDQVGWKHSATDVSDVLKVGNI